jgi:hypothetical protein
VDYARVEEWMGSELFCGVIEFRLQELVFGRGLGDFLTSTTGSNCAGTDWPRLRSTTTWYITSH